MYNFDLSGAHAIFREFQRLHPDDPMGPASDAAVYLFSELDRLHILESDFFTDDEKIRKQRPAPDLEVKKMFEGQLAKAQQLVDKALARSSSDTNATFAKALIYDLRGHYSGLIEKRSLTSLSDLKTGRILAERVLARDSSYYDAYLAIGIENYMLGLNSAPVRLLLRIGGSQTDRQRGLTDIRVTAEKGHLMSPYARTLLAVAALRDKDRKAAKSILQGLAAEFPQNRLYSYELSRLR